MSSGRSSIPLLLQRVPDARKATWPVLPPVLLPYVALMLGVAVASLLASYNAVALRRMRLAFVALAIGAVGWLGFGFAVAALGGLEHGLLALLPARLVNVGLGALLAWTQWPHVRGHEFLGGRTMVLLHLVVVAFAAVLIIPIRPRLVLEGLWLLLPR
jgi:hypothetical protein